MAVVTSLFFMSEDIFAATGFANGVTGGAGGSNVTVTTPEDFETYVQTASPYIVEVSGTIDLGPVDGGVDIVSNKTIRGIGANPKIIGRLGFTDDSDNIIIEKLTITNPSYSEADGISVKDRITNLFIYKCTVYDCGDGCLDISNASDYVTVSWCKFYYNDPAPVEGHRYVNLIGSGDTAYGDRGKLHVTMHHNWWSSRCHQRMPRVRFGQVHVYNNYYSSSGNLYCIGVGDESQLRVENNYFYNVAGAWANYKSPGGIAGTIGWSANTFVGTSIPTWAVNNYAAIFTPTYSYIIGNSADISGIVQAYSGAGTPEPPHWLDYPYGDFTRNNILNMDDFSNFAGYWLTGSADADRDGDGIVNFYEFSLLASNWENAL